MATEKMLNPSERNKIRKLAFLSSHAKGTKRNSEVIENVSVSWNTPQSIL
jgi:hypothetical protein